MLDEDTVGGGVRVGEPVGAGVDDGDAPVVRDAVTVAESLGVGVAVW